MVLPLGCWGIGGGGVCDCSLPRDPPGGTFGSGIDCRLIRDWEIEFLDDNADGPAKLSLGIGGGGWLGGLDCGWLRFWLDELWSSWPLTCTTPSCCVGSLGTPWLLGSAGSVRYPGAWCVETRIKSAIFIVGGPGGWGSTCSLVWTKLGGRWISLPVPYKLTKFSISLSVSCLSSAVRTLSQD